MKSQARVVVIGGGVVGCSVLYHLAKAGWTDAMLIERSELTSGSSWHAAGGFHTLNADPNVARLQAYTVGLYREIEELSGQSCGLHRPRAPTSPRRSPRARPARGAVRRVGDLALHQRQDPGDLFAAVLGAVPERGATAARLQQTTPLYDIMVSERHAVTGVTGLEVPLWFAPEGEKARDVLSFRRSNDFAHVGAEVRAVRAGVGVTEIANFAKYAVTGPGPRAGSTGCSQTRCRGSGGSRWRRRRTRRAS